MTTSYRPAVGDVVQAHVERAFNTGRTIRVTAVGLTSILGIDSATSREDRWPIWDVRPYTGQPASPTSSLISEALRLVGIGGAR